jgi:hypothetical protein
MIDSSDTNLGECFTPYKFRIISATSLCVIPFWIKNKNASVTSFVRL